MALSIDKKYDVISRGLDMFQGNVLMSDKDANIIYANKYLCELYNLTYEEATSMKVHELVDRGILDKSAAWNAYVTKKECVGRLNVNNGEAIDGVGFPIFNDTGEFLGVAAYSYDGRFMRELMKRILDEQKLSEKYRKTIQYLRENGNNHGGIVSDEKMLKIYNMAERVAKSDGTVILFGESGTGKEVLANFIHNNSDRRNEVFVPVNCGAIPNELMEAEFFGYEKGAFTGADKNGKMGLFELADKGTLFLDEIGDLPLSMQSKLLRVLESGEVKRIGGSRRNYVDVRIIAATNKNLKNMVEEGQFRADLYYRINVVPFTIPPLRDRPNDIETLAELFVERYNKKYKKNVALSESVLESFKKYRWPGNVRELKNEIEKIVICAYGDNKEMANDDLLPGSGAAVATEGQIQNNTMTLKKMVEDYERKIITDTLKATSGRVSEAADKLGIHRTLLYKKINKYNIEL